MAAATRTVDQAGIPWLRRLAAPVPPKPARLMTYDFPLREDMLVRLTLPVDLTRSDAARVTTFVGTLAFTDEQLTEGGQ